MKTADEMFAELGYEKIDEDDDIIMFKCKNSRLYIVFSKIAKEVTARQSKTIVHMSYDEILACAQLIKEMRKNDE